jgi:hypothetical protein
MLVLGAGCGENVLVGNLQLRSLSDAGADIAEAIEVDAGPSLQSRYAEDAARKAAKKAADKAAADRNKNNHADSN